MMDVQKQKNVYFLMGQLFRRQEEMPGDSREISGYFTDTRKISIKGSGLVRKIEPSKHNKKLVIVHVSKDDCSNDSFGLNTKKEITPKDINSLGALVGERVSYFGVETSSIPNPGVKGFDDLVGEGYHTLIRVDFGSLIQDGVYGGY